MKNPDAENLSDYLHLFYVNSLFHSIVLGRVPELQKKEIGFNLYIHFHSCFYYHCLLDGALWPVLLIENSAAKT